MEQKKIDRISELTRRSRMPEGLTEAERQERAALRQEYVRAVLGSLDSQLSHTTVVDICGNHRRLTKKEDGQK